MSRNAKILIFSLILIFSIYNKNVNGGLFDNFKDNSTSNTSTKTPKKNSSTKAKKNKPSLPILNQSNQFDIDSPDYTSVPKSGHSPYDAYFGKGVYHQTDNSIVITAPNKTHVVFVVVDTYSKKRIRNEFIRKGETFTMTKIPYGTYDYMYFTGRNWSNSVLINNGSVRGGFKDYKSFNKNDYNEDQMEFKRGYYGSYTIRLTQTIGGNLETKSTSESDFFN
jgi:hypothetical protein